MSDLYVALLSAQKEIKHAIKDSKNPHLKNTYASLSAVLDTVKPIYNKYGLVLTQRVTGGPSAIFVTTSLTHAESGESTPNDAVPVPIKHKFNKEGVDIGPDAQELGSAITYGRRYGLLAVSAIASEDDDGELAVVGAPVSSAGRAPESAPITKEQKDAVTKKLEGAFGWKPLGS